jgi:hypothetical protein
LPLKDKKRPGLKPKAFDNHKYVYRLVKFLKSATYLQALHLYRHILSDKNLDNFVMSKIAEHDRFFFLTHVLNRSDAFNPWLYNRCREVEKDPDGYLDLWAREHYKALDCDTPVFTANRGWTKHVDLKPFDRVFAPDGSQVRVIANTGRMVGADCFSVKTSRGAEIIASGNHLWPVLQKGIKRIVATTQIDASMSLPKVEHHRFRRKLFKPHKNPDKIIDVSPVASRPVNCIQVVGGNYLAGKDFVPTHNSTIITFAGVIQELIKDRELTVGIFSHTRPIAKAFLAQIKMEMEINEKLPLLWPHIFWKNPKKDAPVWSLDSGIIVMRERNPKEASIEAWGLVDGQPAALHVTTPVLTTNGWKEHGKLKDGDFVFDENGKPVEVIFNTGAMHNCDCYKIDFNDTSIIAEANHLWPIDIVRCPRDSKGKQLCDNQYIDRYFATTVNLPISRGRNRSRRRFLPRTPAIFKDKRTNTRRYVRNITKVSSVPVNCIQVKSTTGLYLAGKALVVTHNSKHFKLMVYDDVVTADNCTPQMIPKTTKAWELSQSLSARNAQEEKEARRFWYIGTRYHFGDTYGVILEREAVKPRLYPATDTGTPDGDPVFLPVADWEKKKRDLSPSTLACQYLQNPLAGEERIFKMEWLRYYEVRPETLNVAILVDPADSKSASACNSAFAVIGLDKARNKYLLDGACHKMGLKERWEMLKRLRKKWLRAAGVRLVLVGYEKYGMQADIQYFNERMDLEKYHFPIQQLNWPREGGHSKNERIERLVPDHQTWQFFYPYNTKEQGVTKRQKQYIERGKAYLISNPIMCIDHEKKVYNLVDWFITNEFSFYPTSIYKDFLDAMSRIYDLKNFKPPTIYHETSLLPEEVEDY